MTPSQIQYRKFLKSKFWTELSRERRKLIGKCERCGSTENLNCHHKFYRKDWYETQSEDLEVICRYCHRHEHCRVPLRIFYYPDRPLQFSRFIHWIDSMWKMAILRDRKLTRRDLWYLNRAAKMYPPKKKDGAMHYRITRALSLGTKLQLAELARLHL